MKNVILIMILIFINTHHAHAGFDVLMSEKNIKFVTSDWVPVPDMKVYFEAKADHLGFTTWGCGTMIPVPGYCWHWAWFKKIKDRSDANGVFSLEEMVFKKTSHKWSNLDISITAFGVFVDGCGVLEGLDLYVKQIYKKSSGVTVDLTKFPLIEHDIGMTNARLQEKIEKAKKDCVHH